ncbi:Na+/H+ antiporter subunit E [Haladaptatus caseinilyticus]|uniref:Na+/H+ antiporter subunit E n=1 Tax=Haladaptatus caseinilyticus TaxID=2993314 RepID=UPI00224B36FB|nr:Na+/H+ antiporter subunit E [Haladaptatus caseinilyticus]
MKKWPVIGVVLAILWLFVRGVAFEPVPILGEFLIGLAFGLLIAFSFRKFYTTETNVTRSLKAAPYAILYVAVFLKELATANIDVAYRVLAPSMPIEPGVVVVPLRVKTDGAITTIANSITLTPGTLTMDYDEETNALYVHSIDARDPDAIVEPIRTWEDYALVIFDEEGKPGDPVPEIARERPEVSSTRSDSELQEAEQPDGGTRSEGGEGHGN